jgi:hypothetical protein
VGRLVSVQLHAFDPCISAGNISVLHQAGDLLVYLDALVSGIALLSGIWRYILDVLRSDT